VTLYIGFISDIAVFVLKRDVKLQLTHSLYIGHRCVNNIVSCEDSTEPGVTAGNQKLTVAAAVVGFC